MAEAKCILTLSRQEKNVLLQIVRNASYDYDEEDDRENIRSIIEALEDM